MQNHLAFCQEVKILDPKNQGGSTKPPPASLEVNAATAWTFIVAILTLVLPKSLAIAATLMKLTWFQATLITCIKNCMLERRSAASFGYLKHVSVWPFCYE